MNKYNSILGQMLDLISSSRFEKQVKEHKTEHGAKGLRSWTQFVTMLFSQLTGQHEAGDVLVFDRRYADYGYFASICAKKACFVTRLKKNAAYKRVRKNLVKEGSNIISDYEIIVPSLSEDITLRKITVRDPETKKRVVLLTNNLNKNLLECQPEFVW